MHQFRVGQVAEVHQVGAIPRVALHPLDEFVPLPPHEASDKQPGLRHLPPYFFKDSRQDGLILAGLNRANGEIGLHG